MNEKKISIAYVAPVLLSFFVMSFCDLVGVGVDNAKADFELNNTLAQLIPMAAFAWFFILSVPIGIFQDRTGKRKMLNIGILLTAFGLIMPFFFYSYGIVLAGFTLLGIGNTIIQVSANPLLIDVVPSSKASSFLSMSQFVKSVGSMVAPYLASYFAVVFGDWKLLFLVFGGISLLSVVWLHFTYITETYTQGEKATLVSCLKLLGIGYIALMVLGIFFMVGLDVGINSSSGQFLLDKIDMASEPAKQGRSLYFFGKMLGTFIGAILLTRFSSTKFLLGSSISTLIAVLALILSPIPALALTLMFLIGLAASNIFPLIFSITVKKYPLRASEISGLMIMAISGGALVPPVVGKITDLYSIIAGMYVFVVCSLYLLFVSLYSLKK